MYRGTGAIVLTGALLALNVPGADAASLTVKGTASARAVIVNDGSGDVGTTDDSSDGATSIWADLGYADPSEFLLVGSFTADAFQDPVGSLVDLRLIATVPGCQNCQLLSGVSNTLEGNSENQAVLAFLSSDLMYLGPNGPTAIPLTIEAGQEYFFVLSAGDAAALATVISTYGAGNVRIGLGGFINWLPSDGLAPPNVNFQTVPEPAMLTLLGGGLMALAAHTRRRRSR